LDEVTGEAIYVKKNCHFNRSVKMTPIKRRKREKFAYRIFTRKIFCHYYYVINY